MTSTSTAAHSAPKSRAKHARNNPTAADPELPNHPELAAHSETPPHPGLDVSWPEVLELAQKRFGIADFRSGQHAVLEHVFAGRSALGLMPTGAGKSLTYQLPALLLPRPVVVVSPLIALMQDQQQRAADAHLAVEKIDSTLTAREAHHADQDIADGTAQLIYVTPERLEKQEFLDELNAAGGISLLVVDEAHCIPQWGHDFRPAYMCIGDARRKLGMPPVLALTATATQTVIDEILESLHAKDAAIVNAGTERTNLHFSVHATVNNDAKLSRVTSLLATEPGTGIIYTASTRTADELHEWLSEHKISVGRYHGKMSAHDRERVQREFMAGNHKVMIATKAFGLGIDKPDIRFVYHFEFPDSLETYYQEAGRAGRDGLPSRAVLLYRLEDKRIQSFFMAGRYPSIHELEAVWEAVRDDLPELREPAETESSTDPAQPTVLDARLLSKQSGVGIRKTEVILHLLQECGLVRETEHGFTLDRTHLGMSPESLADMLSTYTDRAHQDRTRLTEMMHYAETSTCRVQIIRRYFSDPEGEPCGRCDNCDNPNAVGLRESHEIAAAATDPDATSTHSGLLPTTTTETHRADQTHDGTAVTRVETISGTIYTTAPETLPHAESPCTFKKGDRVQHTTFGTGKVLESNGDTALVRFPAAGEKKLKCSFLQAIN